MTSKYHCGNCPNQRIVGRIPDIEDCKVLDHPPTEAEKKLIRQIGCMLHPSARAALREEGAKQARGRILKEFEEVIRLHDVDELLYADLYNEFLKIWKVQSLRTAPEEKQ